MRSYPLMATPAVALIPQVRHLSGVGSRALSIGVVRSTVYQYSVSVPAVPAVVQWTELLLVVWTYYALLDGVV